MNHNIRLLRTKFKHKRILHSIIIILAVLLFGLISISCGQDINWDLKNYHFYSGYSLLNGRINYDYVPAQIQTFFNPILSVPTYILLSNLPPKFIGFLIGSIQGVNFWLVYLIAQTTLNRVNTNPLIIPLSLAGLGSFSPMFISEIGTTFGDNITSILILLSVLLVIIAHKRQTNNKYNYYYYCVAGLCSGAAAGLKLTNLLYSIALLATIFVIENRSNKLKQTIITLIGVIIGVILTGGYWMWLMWGKFGSPLFPFYNALFKSPYFSLVNFKDNRWPPNNILDAVSRPFLWSINKHPSLELPFRDLTWLVISILFIVLILSVILKIITKKNTNTIENNDCDDNNYFSISNFIIFFTAFSFFLWLLQFGYQRYLIPLELLSGVTIWCLISRIIKEKRTKTFLYLSLFALILLTTKAPNWGRLEWDKSWFGVTVPEISRPEQTLVVMVSHEPISYVIPFFPEDIRFVRIDGNFVRGIENTLLMQEIMSVINQHNGDFFVLSLDEQNHNYSDMLTKYSLEYENMSCKKLTTRLENMSLCPAKKISIN